MSQFPRPSILAVRCAFCELLLARAGTAIAEVALSPAAFSIFSDITGNTVATASSMQQMSIGWESVE